MNRQPNLDHTPLRDRAWGRFYARKGAARVLHDGEHAPSNRQRLVRFRTLYAGVPIELTLSR